MHACVNVCINEYRSSKAVGSRTHSGPTREPGLWPRQGLWWRVLESAGWTVT